MREGIEIINTDRGLVTFGFTDPSVKDSTLAALFDAADEPSQVEKLTRVRTQGALSYPRGAYRVPEAVAEAAGLLAEDAIVTPPTDVNGDAVPDDLPITTEMYKSAAKSTNYTAYERAMLTAIQRLEAVIVRGPEG